MAARMKTVMNRIKSAGMSGMVTFTMRHDNEVILFAYPGENGKPVVHSIDHECYSYLMTLIREAMNPERFRYMDYWEMESDWSDITFTTSHMKGE